MWVSVAGLLVVVPDPTNYSVGASRSGDQMGEQRAPEARTESADGGEREAVLRDSIDYLQDRLTFVNDKANIFIAIRTGLFVTITWLLGTYFLSGGDSPVSTPAVLVFLVLNFGSVVLIVVLLFQTIRPSDGYFSRYTGVDTVDDTPGVMWPGGGVPAPETFVERAESMSAADARRELIGTTYVLQQLVDRTYGYYRWAVLLMKVQILVVPCSFLTLLVLQYA
jgi:hypothetical protein